ncbi:MAG: Di-glucose binding within endoplasmic reticulum [Planctomycetes bacterium ADurb.Bin126]|nr:MAG: Di-glucose binding within endoplasmic reticulum [Planctomycetes bacterium ADurb.Bin126]
MKNVALLFIGLLVVVLMGCEDKKIDAPTAQPAAKAEPAKKAEPAPKVALPVKVEPAAPSAPQALIRVSAGAEEAYTDQAGNKWLADQLWTTGAKWGAEDGDTVTRAPQKVPNTKAPQVYLTERYNMSGYRFVLPNGKYTVRLHFAETYDGITAAGERVFSVAIQGKQVLKDLDVFKEAGGFAKPLVKEFKDVEVKDGALKITFTEQTQLPEINGIEVLK